MAEAYITYPGDGSTKLFTVPFEYLSREHVHVYLDNDEVFDFTFVSATSISLSSAPAVGAVVQLRRITQTDPFVDFENGANLTASALDTVTLQSLFLAQESQDRAEGSIVKGADDTYQGDGSRLSNIGDPVDPMDVVNKRYFTVKEGEIDQALDTAVADAVAGASAASAASSADAAASATEAASSASASAQSAANAAASESNAATSASSASNTLAQVLAAYDTFDDRYLGEKDEDPEFDNDGDPLKGGALYFNSADGAMKVYSGSVIGWVAAYVDGDSVIPKSLATAADQVLVSAGPGVWAALSATDARAALDVSQSPLNEADFSSDDPDRPPSQQSTGLFVSNAIAEKALGEGQTLQDVSGVRTVNTAYQNTTGRAIVVSFCIVIPSGNERYFQVSPDGTNWINAKWGNGTTNLLVDMVIPDGWYYRFSGSGTVRTWLELRDV